MKFELSLLALGASVALAAPEPVVTPAALLPRQQQVITVGYRSTGVSSGTTLYATVTVNSGQTLTSSGTQFRACATGTTCSWFSCSSGYAVFASTSIACGGSSSTCSYYLLATDTADARPLTNYWCDNITEKGGLILKTTPGGAVATGSATTVASSRTLVPTSAAASSAPSSPTVASTARSTSSSSSTSTSSAAASETSQPSKTPVGAIVGGVVGGVAALGLIALGAIFLLRRNKNKGSGSGSAPAVAQYQQQPPAPQPGQQAPQQGGYPPQQGFYDPSQQGGFVHHEKTPAATTQAYPAYGGATELPMSPAPQYSPQPAMTVPAPNHAAPPAGVNELPAQRM